MTDVLPLTGKAPKMTYDEVRDELLRRKGNDEMLATAVRIRQEVRSPLLSVQERTYRYGYADGICDVIAQSIQRPGVDVWQAVVARAGV